MISIFLKYVYFLNLLEKLQIMNIKFLINLLAMLRLQKLQVQLAKPLFNPNSRKYLRISIGNIVKNTNQAGRIVNDQAMDWSQHLSLPLLYNKQYLFQIYDKHQFGYNPEELQTILNGSFVIDDIAENKGTWEIYTAGRLKIGFLSAEIISKIPSMIKSIIGEKKIIQNKQQQVQSSNQQPTKDNKVLKVSSMVARIPNSNIKKAYIVVQVGQKIIKTSQIKSRSGEIVYIESKQIDLQPNDTDAKIKIYSVKGQGEEVLVAEGVQQLIGSKPSKKVILMKDGHEVGEVYMESKIADKNQINNISYISTSNNKSKISKQFSSAEQIQQSLIKPRAKSISPSKSIDYTRLEDFGINLKQTRVSRANILDYSMISTMSARKKVSVVQNNNNIAFPKEKRFQQYQDKQNERVTYLMDRSFQFKQKKSGRYYRGASIGYGGKTDFTRNKIPGVGNYKLPSIWDRY